MVSIEGTHPVLLTGNLIYTVHKVHKAMGETKQDQKLTSTIE